MNVTPPVYIKPFSKKWWENVWYYYKWFIIGGVIVVILLIMLLAECVFNVQPDFTVTYIGGMENMGQVEAYQLEDRFATVTEDINGDGQQATKVNIIYLDDNNASEEMAAMYSMADIEMAGGDAVVFLISEAFLDCTPTMDLLTCPNMYRSSELTRACCATTQAANLTQSRCGTTQFLPNWNP